VTERIPEYARPGATRLPKGGPDRVRFCVWYERALDEGKTDEEARSHARGCLFLLYAYAGSDLVAKLGPNAGGVPIDQLGEE
jgi:hypothetical protein